MTATAELPIESRVGTEPAGDWIGALSRLLIDIDEKERSKSEEAGE